MKTIRFFEVKGHTDTTEGRGPMRVVARFSNREAATEYVTSKAYARHCVMGCQNPIADLNNIAEVSICIVDTVEELQDAAKEDLKAAALSKLTKEERAALGL